jgi:hypothetical protein
VEITAALPQAAEAGEYPERWSTHHKNLIATGKTATEDNFYASWLRITCCTAPCCTAEFWLCQPGRLRLLQAV